MLAKLNPCAGRTTFTDNYCRDSCNIVMLAVMRQYRRSTLMKSIVVERIEQAEVDRGVGAGE